MRQTPARLLPQILGDQKRIDIAVNRLPPFGFIAGLVQLTMMGAAERNGELIAHFEPQRAGLGKAQVMGIRGGAAAEQTRLRHDEFQMRRLPQTLGPFQKEPSRFGVSRQRTASLERRGRGRVLGACCRLLRACFLIGGWLGRWQA